MDLAKDDVCDLQCNVGCKHGGKLCRRWVQQFEARPEYVLELERDNEHYMERAERCYALARDCMAWMGLLVSSRQMTKAKFAELSDRARRLAIELDE